MQDRRSSPNFIRRIQAVTETIQETFVAWRKSNPVMLSASLSFFATFSIIPFFVITIVLIGQFYGREEAAVEIIKQINAQFGFQATLPVKTILNKSQLPGAGWASLFSLALLLVLASPVFQQLQMALNSIWHVQDKKKRGFIKNLVIKRLISFAMIIGLGAFIFLTLAFDTLLEPLHTSLKGIVSSAGEVYLWNIITFSGSLLLFTLLFAMIFKFVPEAQLRWKEVWIGGFVTSLLFGIGKEILSFYLRTTDVGSFYGAMGSIVVILIWIYFSTHFFIMGAQFTWIYSNKWGKRSSDTVKNDIPNQIGPTPRT